MLGKINLQVSVVTRYSLQNRAFLNDVIECDDKNYVNGFYTIRAKYFQYNYQLL